MICFLPFSKELKINLFSFLSSIKSEFKKKCNCRIFFFKRLLINPFLNLNTGTYYINSVIVNLHAIEYKIKIYLLL